MLKDERRFSGSFRNFKDLVKANGPQMAKDLSEFIPISAGEVRKELLDKASTMFGILCLSRRRDSILMWGHYCDKYQGLVIGFDGTNSVFRPAVGKGLRPVTYVRERVTYDATWDESDPGIKVFDEQITFSKNEDWRYEEEMRQIFDLSSLKRRQFDDGTLGFFLPVPPEALVSVTLGARCPGDVEKKVRSCLTQPSLARVTVDRAVLHDSKFALVFE